MSRVNPRLVYWIAALYNHKELKAAHHLILIYLATKKLDYSTGAGYCSAPALVAELGSGESTVRRALDIAQKVGVLEQTSRGGRRGDDTVAASTWQILYPPQPLASERLTSSSTAHERAVDGASTARNDGLNRSLAAPQPLASERPSGSEISGSESSSGSAAIALALLRAVDATVTEEETDSILDQIKSNGGHVPLAVLRGNIRDGLAVELIAAARAALNGQSDPSRHPSARTIAEAVAVAVPDGPPVPSTEEGRRRAIEEARQALGARTATP